MAAVLALTTSLCYGLSNFIGPVMTREAPLYAVLIAGQVLAFTVSATVILVSGLPVPGGTVFLAAAVAGFGNAWGLIALYRAFELGPLSIVIPVGSVAVVVPVFAGVASGESLGAVKLAGLALAIAGVVLAARRRSAAPLAEGQDVRAAAAWALFGAVGFGIFLACMAPASDEGVFWALMLSRATLLTVLAVAVVVLAAPVRTPGRQLPAVAVPGVLLFAGTLAYSAATREGDLSVVSVLSSLFPVVTVALAVTLLGERLSRSQAVGVVAAIAGVVLISVHA